MRNSFSRLFFFDEFSRPAASRLHSSKNSLTWSIFVILGYFVSAVLSVSDPCSPNSTILTISEIEEIATQWYWPSSPSTGNELMQTMSGDFAIGRSLTEDIWGNNYYFVVYGKSLDPFVSKVMVETGGHWERSLNSMFLHLWSSYGLNDADDDDIIVLDLGAALGSFTLFAASLGARVWAFEMQYSSYTLLEMSLRLSGYRNRVKLFKHAVWSKTGETAFYSAREGNPGAVFARTETQGNAHEQAVDQNFNPVPVDMSATKYEVSTICLDDLSIAKPESSKRIFFVKMDVEGAEPYALEGMVNLLLSRRILHFTIEIRDHSKKLLDPIFNLGYTCRAYDEEYCQWPELPCHCYVRSIGDVDLMFAERDPYHGLHGYIDFHCSLNSFHMVDPLYPKDCETQTAAAADIQL